MHGETVKNTTIYLESFNRQISNFMKIPSKRQPCCSMRTDRQTWWRS